MPCALIASLSEHESVSRTRSGDGERIGHGRFVRGVVRRTCAGRISVGRSQYDGRMMKVPPASAATKTAYDDIVGALSTRGAESGAMFGMPSAKVGGKGFMGVFGDALVFKLTGAAHEGALALKGAALFDPSGAGRAMKEWVVVPKAHAKRWPSLAEAAFDYVAAAAPAKKKTAATKTKAKKKTVARKR
jgi:hypothetical protein